MKKIITISITLLASQVFASGLSKPVWVGPKAIGMGGAFVGVADDTTAMFHNPAGITQLKHDHNIQIGADSLITNLNYTPPAGTTEKAQREFLPVPSFGYVNNQLDTLSFGMGLFFPHGNGGKFSTPSAVPSNPNEGRIYSMELVPTVAFKISPKISLGAGLRITRISTSLKGQLFPIPGVGVDNLKTLDVAGWGYGATAGILLTPTDWLKIGANYRSNITKTLSGDGEFAAAGPFDATLRMALPTVITSGFSAQATKKLLLSFQHSFERNSEIKDFKLTSSLTGPAQIPLNQLWKNSQTFHFGAKFDVCKEASLIAGYARDFDKSIPDAVMNRVTGDIDAHEASGGILVNLGRYNAGLAWNGRWGERDIPVTATNVGPGNYKAFIHTISANIGIGL